MEYLWRHVKDSFLMGEGEKVRREDPKKSKTGNKLKQDQVQRWKKDDPLTEDDHKMLDLLIRYYEKHGYSPSQKDMPNSTALKRRFGIWKKPHHINSTIERCEEVNTMMNEYILVVRKK